MDTPRSEGLMAAAASSVPSTTLPMAERRSHRRRRRVQHAPELTPEEEDEPRHDAPGVDEIVAADGAVAVAVRGADGALFVPDSLEVVGDDSVGSVLRDVPSDVEGGVGGSRDGDGLADGGGINAVGNGVVVDVHEHHGAPVSSITAEKSPRLLLESRQSSLSDGEGRDNYPDAGGAGEDGAAAVEAGAAAGATRAVAAAWTRQYELPLQPPSHAEASIHVQAQAGAAAAGTPAPQAAAPLHPPHPHYLRFPRNASTDGSRSSTGGFLGGYGFYIDEDHDLSESTPASLVVTAPTDVFEGSRSSQELWKKTKGHRPPQPPEERAFYEKIWAHNFLMSQASYEVDQRNGMGGHPLGGKGSNRGDVPAVVVRGDNVFGTTVSKSFERRTSSGTPDPLRPGADTVSISIASYRVVESRKHGKYAQFLVIYCEGSFRDTLGVWKRYSDFRNLSQKVMHGQGESCSSVLAGMHPTHILHVAEDSDEEEGKERDLLPNAVTSWKLLRKRQKWFRCLDAEYLSLKVFLLERFLHDILFESSSPDMLRDFVGVNPKRSKKGSSGSGEVTGRRAGVTKSQHMGSPLRRCWAY